MSEIENAAIGRAARFGLAPLRDPLGDDHHTDIAFSAEDRAVGDALAWFLGSMYCDVTTATDGYFYNELTAVEEWSRVARALRIHGLKICNR